MQHTMVAQMVQNSVSLKEVIQRCSAKKVFLEISPNLQENTCARDSFLIKLQAPGLQLYQKRATGTRVFLLILRDFQEHLFLKNTSGGCFYLFFIHIQSSFLHAVSSYSYSVNLYVFSLIFYAFNLIICIQSGLIYIYIYIYVFSHLLNTCSVHMLYVFSSHLFFVNMFNVQCVTLRILLKSVLF